MTEVRYAAGSLRAVVAGRGVVVLGEGATDAATRAIRDRLAVGEGFGAVVDALAAGGSLAALPAFVVVVDEGAEWRVSVRGALTATVTTPSGTETVDGSAASTWSERSIPGVSRLVVGADASDASLPIADGVVLVSVVVVSAENATAPAPVSEPEPEPAGPALPAEPVQPHSVAEVSASEAPPVAAPVPTTPPPMPAVAEGLLIDSIPPFIRGDSLPMRPAAAATPKPATPKSATMPATVPGLVPTDAEVSAAADDLEATTVVGRPLRNRVRTPDPEPAADADSPAPGDHDGETLSLAEARRLRAAGSLPAPPPPVVAARAPVAAPTGPIGRLRLSTGQLVPLDRSVIVGRRPGSTRASGADMPHLVGVDSPQQDISRNHIEVRTEGDSILVTDLQTTNGTTLRRPGSAPTRLHPGEATILVPGDVLDLGDGVTVAVEAMQ